MLKTSSCLNNKKNEFMICNDNKYEAEYLDNCNLSKTDYNLNMHNNLRCNVFSPIKKNINSAYYSSRIIKKESEFNKELSNQLYKDYTNIKYAGNLHNNNSFSRKYTRASSNDNVYSLSITPILNIKQTKYNCLIGDDDKNTNITYSIKFAKNNINSLDATLKKHKVIIENKEYNKDLNQSYIVSNPKSILFNINKDKNLSNNCCLKNLKTINYNQTYNLLSKDINKNKNIKKYYNDKLEFNLFKKKLFTENNDSNNTDKKLYKYNIIKDNFCNNLINNFKINNNINKINLDKKLNIVKYDVKYTNVLDLNTNNKTNILDKKFEILNSLNNKNLNKKFINNSKLNNFTHQIFNSEKINNKTCLFSMNFDSKSFLGNTHNCNILSKPYSFRQLERSLDYTKKDFCNFYKLNKK